MINTAAITATDRTATTQGGHGGNAAGSATTHGNEFLAAVNRITFSSSPAATIAQNTQILDTTRPTDDADRISDRRDPPPPHNDTDPVTAERPKPRETQSAAEETTETDAPEAPYRPSAQADETTADAEPPAAANAVPQNTETPSAPHTQSANQAPGNAAAAHQAPTGQPSAQPLQTAQANTDAPDPESAQQQTRPQTGQANGPLRAQVVDAAATEQLPQTSQTLSSRAALVAQSQAAKGAATADAVLRDAAADPGVSSLAAGAARSATQGAQKGKSAARTGTPAQPVGAAAAQASQTPAQQTPAQAAAPFQGQLQQNLATSQFGSGTGSNSTGQQSLAGRAEAFGASGTGQATPQFNPRAAAPAQTPRTPPQLPARIVANQVAVQIQKAAGDGNDRISIQLKPADLGRVDVRLDVGSDGRVAAVISADRSDTLDLLQRDARILQNALQDAGLQADSDSLSFTLNGQNQAFGDSASGSSTSGEFTDADIDVDLPVAAATLRPGIVTSDRIDIQI